VSLKWKLLRLCLIPAIAMLVTGCGGFSATRSISPATFLLPGLMQADPQPEAPDRDLPAGEPLQEVAQF